MAKPLNKALYCRLKRLFGSVKISMTGQAHKHSQGRGHEDEKTLIFEQDGEYYQVCCPYCSDTRHRLYVNHMFGKTDAWGRRMNFVAYCFNEGCLYKPENRADFVDNLEDLGQFLKEASVRQGVVLPEEARAVLWPGPCKLLTRLEADHPARAYLESRNFDPDEITKKFEVCYCTDSHMFLARNRLVIPIIEKGELRGWQCRYVGELAWKDKNKKKELPPKYFSCPNSQFRSRCVYNWERMKQWQTGVIVEGPTDVWSFGSMAGCIFGNTMTEWQKKKVLSVFRSRTLILLLDPDQFEARRTKQLIAFFERRMSGRFAAVKLPEGTDPGSLGRDFLKEYVREEAGAKGVKVIYKKVA